MSTKRPPRFDAPPVKKPGTQPPVATAPIPVRGIDRSRDFAALSSSHPLVLLPVRLETRFAGSTVKIRIYPDQIHLDEHRRSLTAAEIEQGTEFWRHRLAARDDAERSAATAWLVERVPARRAAYVARMLRPKVAAGRPVAFPALAPDDTPAPAVAAALPDRWAVVGWVAGKQRFVEFAKHSVASKLAFAPSFEAVPWSTDDPLLWMTDYDRAVESGMAVTVTLDDALLRDVKAHGLTLLAIGIRGESPEHGARRLADLLDAHHHSDGLALLPQGTPTNNTDSASAGWSAELADLDDWFARELDEAGVATSTGSDGPRLATALGVASTSVLARLPHATDATDAAAAAMNRALWPVTLGRYLTDLLAPESGGPSVVPPSAIDVLRDWFATNVRGCAQLSTVAVGSQPYGVLPVRRSVVATGPVTGFATLENTLLALRDSWRASLGSVPRLDPVAGDDIGSDPEDDVVTILGSLPHPARFIVRRLTYQRELRLLFWQWIWLELRRTDSPLFAIGQWYTAERGSSGDITSQLDTLDRLRAALPSLGYSGSALADAQVVVDAMISMAQAHLARQDPHQTLFPALSKGVFDDTILTDPKLFWSGYGNATNDRVFTRPLVVSAGAKPGARSIDYLGELVDRLGARRTEPSRKHVPLTAEFHADEPLLYQLLDPVVTSAPARIAYREALETLQGLRADELELRLRETLGLVSHRLDAWITSLARARLDAMRAKAAGVQLGGFGWVENLRPDCAGTRESQGFIHAPSLAQATTAAVLRAGWTAHGGTSGSPMAIDLRSDRVRTAAWLLDGVRAGSSLGDLLGCRFERMLHDTGAAAAIDACRRAVLGDDVAPRGPVDGLALLELHRGAGVAISGAMSAKVQAALLDLESAFDAVADATTADAVHHVLQGNRSRAAAMLDAAATGEVVAPELRFATTPRGAITIVHRVMITFGVEPVSGSWGQGPRATAAPGLEAWCAQLLGDPARIRCTVHAAGDVIAPVEVTMAEIVAHQSPSALDVVYEAAQGGEDAWRKRALACVLDREGMAGLEGALTVDLTASMAVSFQEAMDLARAVHQVIARGRPLDGRDLALPTASIDGGLDVAEAESRARAAANAFERAVDRLAAVLPAPTEDDVTPVDDGPLHPIRTRMAALADFGVPGAVPARGWTDVTRAPLYADAWALLSRARSRLDQLNALPRLSQTPTDEERLARARERFAGVFGPGFPLAPRLSPAGIADTIAAFAHGPGLIAADPDVALGWLSDVAKVRPQVAVLDDALGLADLLADGVQPVPAIAQLPHDARDPWVARAAPVDRSQGRVSLFAIDRGAIAAMSAGTAFAGLVVDSWVDTIPAPDMVTGVAVHFDAPSSRPPQAMLVVVPPDGERWSFDLVVDSVAETMELAQLRAVDPDVLLGFGHQLPAIFPPGAINAGTQPEAS